VGASPHMSDGGGRGEAADVGEVVAMGLPQDKIQLCEIQRGEGGAELSRGESRRGRAWSV